MQIGVFAVKNDTVFTKKIKVEFEIIKLNEEVENFIKELKDLLGAY